MKEFLGVFFQGFGGLLWTLVTWAMIVLLGCLSYKWLFRPAILSHWAFGATFWCVGRSILFLGVVWLMFVIFSQIIALWKGKSPAVAYVLLVLLFWIIGRFFLVPPIFHILSPRWY
ncbi:MAG: hypothetical protein WC465_03760 [Patescibacteria group bacterium]